MAKTILLCVYFLLLAVNLLAAIKFSGSKQSNKYFLSYFILVIFREAVGFALQQSTFNHFLIYHILRPWDFAILCLMYREGMTGLKIKKFFNLLIILFFIFSYTYSFLFNHYNSSTALASSIQNVLMLVLVLSFFYETYENAAESNLKRVPLFWISVGFLFFSTGTFFSTGFQSYLQSRNLVIAKKIFWLNYVWSYFLYSMFLIGQLCKMIFRK